MQVYFLESYRWFDYSAKEIKKEGKTEPAITIYTIKINGKIHTAYDKYYATKLAIKKNGKNKQRR